MRRKLAIIGFSYLCGLIFASVFINTEAIISIAITAVVTAVIVLSIFKHKYFITLVSASILCGFVIYAIKDVTVIKPALSLDNGTSYEMKADVRKVVPLGNDLCSYIFHADINGNEILFSAYSDDIDCKAGDKVELSAKFKALSGTISSSSEDILNSDGIFLKAYSIKNLSVISKGEQNGISKAISDYRNFISDSISELYPLEDGALMKAMFLGNKSDLSPITKVEIKAAGAAHLTAVSGMHLTLIIAIFAAFLDLLRICKLPRLKIALIILATAVFIVFFDFSASVMRAGIMIIIFYCGKLFFAKSDCFNSVGCALIIILIFDPLAFKDAGLVFSCVTTIGAGHISPAISKNICEKAGIKYSYLISLFTCCICCSITSIPISMMYFGTFSAISVLTSIVSLPFFTICIVFMLIYTLTGGFFDILLYPAHFSCKVMEGIFSTFSKLPFASFSVESVFSLYFISGAVFIGTALYIVLKQRRIFSMAVYSLTVIAVLFGHSIYDKALKDDIIVTPYSDGEDGFVLIESKNECGAIILGGGKRNISELYARMLSENISKLDYVQIVYDNKNILPYFENTFGNYCSCIVSDENNLSETSSERFNIKNCYESNNVLLDSKKSVIHCGNHKISISSVSNKDIDSLNICYGYKKETESTSVPTVCINKKQESNSDVLIYYTPIKIQMNADKGILIKEV